MAQRNIEFWSDLSLTELFYAFRKAKADCYFERSLFVAREFVDYESTLPTRLTGLLERLQTGQIIDVLTENLGEPHLVAKKLSAKPKTDKKIPNGHGFFSNPDRAFQHLCVTHDLTPEFRLVGNFPVEMHILSALWINLVGHKFDAALTKSAYGNRLRRYRPELGSPEGTLGPYHTEAIGSFYPYFVPYRQWRERGLKAIRQELEADRSVIAITMDLNSYYHRIAPAFMKGKCFHDYAKIELTPWEKAFTSDFADALVAWSDRALAKLVELGCEPKQSDVPLVGGLPIGLSISRVVSNALLIGLDREIEQQLSPVYYGRYVDDIFIVLRDPGDVVDFPKLQKFIAKRTSSFPPPRKDQENIYLQLPGAYQGETTLLLQQSKQKVFFLDGQGGLDLLDSIESQIRSVSSERRLMPNPDNLESMAAAKVLAAAGQASEEADTLRKADGLSVRRLGWSVLLRAVEILSRDLRPDDWKTERRKFYQFALNHILRPDKIFDHLDYLPRLLSLAVALKDWPDAKRLFDAALAALTQVERVTIECIRVNGHDIKVPERGLQTEWESVRDGVRKSAADAISRSLRWGKRKGGLQPLPKVAFELCEAVGLLGKEDDLESVSLAIREADWAKVSYKDHLHRDATRQRPAVSGEDYLAKCYDCLDDLSDFLRRSKTNGDLSTFRVHPRAGLSATGSEAISFLPYLFPTRPYSTEEVSLFLPQECVLLGKDGDKHAPTRNWARYVRALRGVWVWESLLDPGTQEPSEANPNDINLAILGGKSHKPVLLGISSLLTSDDTWKAAASGRSDLSRSRYKRIEDVVNQAIKASPKPTHLLLPELSLPERWLGTVTGLLRDSGISLIAGLDYHVAERTIHSEAVLVLADDRLGFPAFVRVHQPKTLPAPGEDFLLQRDFGKRWTLFPGDRSAKPVYLHKGFAFGVLVCSELQNVQHRLNFQGAVDCMMVLSWNQDLETFSALVESASLDVHAYVALVNNRRFGDSRVRAPEKTNHKRDVCRLRGGENEHVVVVNVDIHNLREFQSRANRWPDEDDPFKPVPEGFRIHAYRMSIPS
ncbi:RNA-directed DNA polymerase [Acidithiobacillus sp. AMEEHan]|uniref:RNA-directed DNA polymerase n=1 Tax=Acidithiobacillus sp. AMEEHan TaxID=2994951 RepID=UPI0027E3BAAF|nr:RNA-directed DNA polymerase [Acidithiobacillus sp. AMEEHan]